MTRRTALGPALASVLAIGATACSSAGEVELLTPTAPRAPDVQARAWQAALSGGLGCPELANARDLCIATDWAGGVMLLDLADIRRPCTTHAFSPGGSFAWVGNRIYACDPVAQAVAEVSLETGMMRLAPLPFGEPCMGLTRYGTRLVVLGAYITIYDSFDDVLAGRPSMQLANSGSVSRAVAIGDTLYGAMHSTDRLERWDLARGEPLSPIPLEVDDWIFGLAADRSGNLVTSRPSRLVSGIELREPVTAQVVRTLPDSQALQDLAGAIACGGALLEPAPPAARPADPVRITGPCGDQGVSAFDSGLESEEPLHIVAVYTAVSSTVAVHLERPGPARLVLSSYEAVPWRVSVGPETRLEGIIVSSYHVPTVEAPPGTPIERHVFNEGGLPFGYAHTWESYEARRLRYTLESELGLPVRSFGGCFAGERFEIR
jgi:hypothetical protein